MPYQLPFGLLMLIIFGAIAIAAWKETLPIGTGWRGKLLIHLFGETGVFRMYIALGGIGVLVSVAMILWGVVLLF